MHSCEGSASRGNRFILASRPAAVQPVDIPDAFTFLHLRGLTEAEIRILAGRVFTARLGLGEDHNPSDEEAQLVDQLVADTRNKPGHRTNRQKSASFDASRPDLCKLGCTERATPLDLHTSYKDACERERSRDSRTADI